MFEYLPIFILLTEIVLLVLYSLYLYRNIFNPLAIFACLSVGMFTVGSYLNTILFKLDIIDYPINSLNEAVYISAIWLASFSLGFLPIPKWIYHKYSLPITTNPYKGKNFFLYYSLLAFLSLIFFSALCYFSNPLEWLTNPRIAYLYYRVGVGHFYLGFVWTTLILFTSILFFQRPKVLGLLIWIIIFFIILYFSGKKGIMMSLFVIASVYYHFYIKNLSLLFSIIIVISIFSITLFVIAFHANQSFLAAFSYFDYIDTTARFLNRFDEFGYYLGYTFISEYWVLVPRMFFPEKPFDYGHSLIHAILYPGVAETGHTSGYLIWTPYYLDFGIFGVAIYGFILGLFKRVVFNTFLMNKNNFILFCMCIHFTISETWFYLPTAIVILFFYICFKLSKIKFY